VPLQNCQIMLTIKKCGESVIFPINYLRKV